MAKELSIDIETFSSVDITKQGAYKYTETEDFEILLFGYAYGDDPVTVVDLKSGELLPEHVQHDLLDPNVIKTAHNAAFEMLCINRDMERLLTDPAMYRNVGGSLPQLGPEHWRCTMVHGAMLGLPMRLEDVATALHMDELKDKEGKALIKFFCCPHVTKKPEVRKLKIPKLIALFREAWLDFTVTAYDDREEYTDAVLTADMRLTQKNNEESWEAFMSNCDATVASWPDTYRNLPVDHPEKWQRFKEYCAQDVVVERSNRKKLSIYAVPQREQELWGIDQRINDRGVKLDLPFIHAAIKIDNKYRAILTQEAIQLTGIENPNSGPQIRAWLEEAIGEEVPKLRKDDVKQLITDATDDTVKRMLRIRQKMSKSSIKKYASMLKCICADGRARGLLQFYGAGRTGREAGRLIQPQNMPRINMEPWELDMARDMVLAGDMEGLQVWGDIPDILSQLLRTALIADDGKEFLVADFSAIEARVAAWLANCSWRLEVFKTHGKIYEASASAMFKVALETIKKGQPNYHLRQKGKVAELALGYGGGVNALITMGALKQGLREEELQPLVDAWRKANPEITRYWKVLENAAIEAIDTGAPQHVKPNITFFCSNNVLYIELPNGRRLSYRRPKLLPDKYGVKVTYEGVNQLNKKWQRLSTYGGKLLENIDQAIARDCLFETIYNMNGESYNTVLHVHDEVVNEEIIGARSLADMEAMMSKEIPWAKGLPLGADGFTSKYYKK